MERVLGPDYPHTLALRNNLAAAYHVVGQLVEAIPCSRGQLADRERVLGPDHPHTLTSRINLPGAYESAGRVTEAIPAPISRPEQEPTAHPIPTARARSPNSPSWSSDTTRLGSG
jgi:Tetratricopeptide repeat